jgi:opacity protein-like surface antigen
MRKKGLMLFVCLLLLLPLPGLSKAEKFAVKLSGGMNYLLVGDVNKGVKGVIDNLRDSATVVPGTSVAGEAKPIHLGFDFEGYVIINLTSLVGIGFGAGYIQGAKISELTVRFPEGPETSFTTKPKISAVPIRLGVFYTLPMNEMINVVFNVGAGLYLAKYSYYFLSEGAWIGNTINQKASAKGFGFHGGIGFEFNLAPNIAFVLEGQGRYAKIGGLEGTAEYAGSSLPYTEKGALYYWEQTSSLGKYPRVLVQENEPSGPLYSNVKGAKVDFSGFAFSVGIKINL